MDSMERAENRERRDTTVPAQIDVGLLGVWRTADPFPLRTRLRVHPATRVTIPTDLEPLLAQLEEAAQRSDRVWSLTHLEHAADGGILCAIWWDEPDGERRLLRLPHEPEDLLGQFRLCCDRRRGTSPG